jgi:hypothetical protein
MKKELDSKYIFHERTVHTVSIVATIILMSFFEVHT